ncbi:MAG TPA: hypothetical protein VM432_01915 [Bdellovibrionales bacterium]|jgi:hypothetical protein|nr:hypothetical protein [Bdellovibrionales bacterium]
MKLRNAFILSGLISALALPVLAQDGDEASSESTLAATAAAERQKRRNYPGGHDDQDLTVQPSLPAPARAPEAQSQVSTTPDEVDHD